MKTELHILKAYHGDCLLIKTFNINAQPFNILIDGGPPNTFNFALRSALEDITSIDLLVLTHIDSDHIGGLINFTEHSLFQEIDIKKFWVNCANLIDINVGGESISYDEGVKLEKHLIYHKVPKNKFGTKVTNDLKIQCRQGVCFEILSPTSVILDAVIANWPQLSEEYQEKLADVQITNNAPSQLDKGSLKELAAENFRPSLRVEKDLFNAMSIAFILRTPDISILLLADSRPEIIVATLVARGYNKSDNQLKVDYVKVSHHGSKNNTNNDVLDMLDCPNFIFSTDGGIGRSKHPNRETVARILYHPNRDMSKRIKLFFNYPLADIIKSSGRFFTDAELEEANAEYLDDISQLPHYAA